MNDLITRNRIGARSELELAIDLTELSIRLAKTHEEHEHDTHLLEQLKQQREPEVRHVRVGRGAA